MHGRSSAGGVDPRVERSLTVIRQAALDELAEVGYGAFTIESVAARARAGKSTIYRHWRDKLDLIADAFENAHEHMVPSNPTGTATERITLLVRHVAEVVVHSAFSRCIPALIEGAQRDHRLRKFHQEYSAKRRRSLTDLIIEGIGSGEFAASVDPELAVQAILGAIFYGRLMSAEPFDPARASELVETVLRPRS
jgi:TetR/AcrR family transcriptional regulator of autoinduction and epiphytic fitness